VTVASSALAGEGVTSLWP